MPSAHGIRAGAAYVELFLKDNRLVRGLAVVSQKLQAFGAGITSIGSHLTGLGVTALAPFLLAAKVFADVGSSLNDMSERTGISIEALSELGFAAELSGSNMETLETGIRKMQKLIVAAASGSREAKDALARLGLTVADLGKLSPEKQFEVIADRLAQIRNPTVRAAMALDIFGKSGTQLLPMLSGGAKGLQAMRDQASKLGLTVSSEDAKAADEFGDALDTLWKVLKQGVFVVGSALAPALKDLAEWLIRVVVTASDWIRRNKDVVVTVFKVVAAVVAAGIALTILGTVITGIGAGIGAVATLIGSIGAAIGAIGALLSALLTPAGLAIAVLVGLASVFLFATDTGAEALAWLGDRFGELKDIASAALGGISDALMAGDFALAAKILWLSLQLVWKQGIHALNEKWIAFKEFFLATGTDAFFGLSKIMTNAWAGLQRFWTETVATMSTAWTVFTSSAVSAWKTAQNFIGKGIAKLMSLLDDSVDADATIAVLQEDFDKDQKARERQTQQRLAGIEQERKQRQADIEKERGGIVEGLEKNRQEVHAKRRKDFEADLADTDAELKKARDEFQKALDEAAAKRADIPEPERMRRMQAVPDVDEIVETAQQKLDVQGTFNAAAVRGLGASSVGERTARATEQTAANTKRLLQEAARGGLVFK